MLELVKPHYDSVSALEADIDLPRLGLWKASQHKVRPVFEVRYFGQGLEEYTFGLKNVQLWPALGQSSDGWLILKAQVVMGTWQLGNQYSNFDMVMCPQGIWVGGSCFASGVRAIPPVLLTEFGRAVYAVHLKKQLNNAVDNTIK